MFVLTSHEVRGDDACRARRKGDKSVRVLPQHFQIDPGFVIKAVGKSDAAEANEVSVTGKILGEENEMVVDTPAAAFFHALLIDFLVEARSLRHDVHLASDDRLDAGFFCRLIEFDRPEHDSVVGEGDGRHLVLDGRLDQAVDRCRTVKEAVMRVVMKMDKLRHRLRRGSATFRIQDTSQQSSRLCLVR